MLQVWSAPDLRPARPDAALPVRLPPAPSPGAPWRGAGPAGAAPLHTPAQGAGAHPDGEQGGAAVAGPELPQPERDGPHPPDLPASGVGEPARRY